MKSTLLLSGSDAREQNFECGSTPSSNDARFPLDAWDRLLY
jgi:hypothetical protein